MNRTLPLSAGGRLAAAAFAALVAAVLAFSIAALALPRAAVAAPGDLVRGTAVADVAYYASADPAAEPAGSFPAGTTLQALEQGDGWYAARVDGAVCYFQLTEANFAFYTAGGDATVLRGAVVGGALDVLAVPASGGAANSTFANGATIQFCRFNDSYYMARLSDGSICYIDASRVRLYSPVESGTLTRWAGEGGARVFEAPDASSVQLASFEAGTRLYFADFDSEWLMASMSFDGVQRTVFVPKSDVVAEEPVPEPEPEPEPAQTSWIITTAAVTARTEADAGAAAAETFRKGAVFTGLDTGTGWYRIAYDGQTMYLAADQVKVIPASSYAVTERTYGVSLADAVSIQNDGSWIVGNSSSNRATADDLALYMDPDNFPAGTSGFFQFLVLTQPLGVSVDTLNAQLAGKGVLEGQGQAFHDAAYDYGINEAYLVAQALHETGNGSSTLAQGVWYVPQEGAQSRAEDESGVAYTSYDAIPEADRGRAAYVYNVYGIGAVDSDPLNGGARYAYWSGWTSPYDAVYGGARFIGRTYFASDAELGYGYASTLSGQNTLYKMLYHPEWVETYGSKPWHEYATDVAWANAQTYYITQMLADYDSYTLTFEVPNYVG